MANIGKVAKVPEEVNCAICREVIVIPAYCDPCLHEFCYPCLTEWTRYQNRCPICRQVFTSILHNIREDRDYDMEPVGQPMYNPVFGFIPLAQVPQRRPNDAIVHLYPRVIFGAQEPIIIPPVFVGPQAPAPPVVPRPPAALIHPRPVRHPGVIQHYHYHIHRHIHRAVVRPEPGIRPVQQIHEEMDWMKGWPPVQKEPEAPEAPEPEVHNENEDNGDEDGYNGDNEDNDDNDVDSDDEEDDED